MLFQGSLTAKDAFFLVCRIFPDRQTSFNPFYDDLSSYSHAIH